MMNPIVRTVMSVMARQGGDAMMVFPSGDPVYDVNTSTSITPTVTYPVRVLIFDYVKKTDGAGVVGNSLIESGDKQVFVQPTYDLPKPKARISSLVIQDVTYNVITVKAIDPAGTGDVILYELFVRG